MGTSTINRGQGGNSPLVPSWLDDKDTVAPSAESQDTKSPQEGQTSEQDSGSDGQNKPQFKKADPKRFTAPRSNFTRFINSKSTGGGRNLRRAASSYVKHSTGGSQNATMRLGSARQSTARLFSVLGGFARSGVFATAQAFHLGDIVGKPAKEAFLRIMDLVCPDGGKTDDGIARNAYIEAISTIPDLETKQIETLTASELLAFTELYMTNVIMEKIENDVGNKIIALPDDIAQVDNLQGQLKDLIKGCVSDAFAKVKIDIANIDAKQTQKIADSVYKTAFDVMSNLED